MPRLAAGMGVFTLASLIASAHLLPPQVIEDFESGRFDGWRMSGNCWGSGPENARFAGRNLAGWEGLYFLSSAHPAAPGWDVGSGTGRALSPAFRIAGDTFRFRIGGGRQYGKCGVRLLVDGEEVFSETGNSPFQLRPVAWDVRPYRGKTGQIEVFDNATTGVYAYVHCDDFEITTEAEPDPSMPPAPAETLRPALITEEKRHRISPSPVGIIKESRPPVVRRRKPLSTGPFPTELGPPPPIAPYTTETLPDEKVMVPMIFPLTGNVAWHDNYNDDRGPHRHTGIDIPTPKMHPIVAPFSGVLGFKVYTFWIYGDNGYRCLGTHLNDDTPGTNDNSAQRDFMFAPNLRPGDRVTAGQFIGYVGNSGDATGPHLHFEIFSPDGIRSPAPSLRAAQRIPAPRIHLEQMPAAPSAGQVCVVGCFRGFEPNHRVLALQLVARQRAPGGLTVVTAPTRYYARLTSEMVASVGVEALQQLPRDREIIIYGTEIRPNFSLEASKAIFPPTQVSE